MPDSISHAVHALELLEAQIAARSRMYDNSARQAFERAKTRAAGVPSLPQYPGDGSTQCRCITTPAAPVLTKRGWVPMHDVIPGDLVFTHKLRWRPVTGTVAKPAHPDHREYLLITPLGTVGATHNHLWHTAAGWSPSNRIDNSLLSYYNGGEEVYHAQEMQGVWARDGQSGDARHLPGLSFGVSLWQSQRPTSCRVYELWHEPQGQEAMGRLRYPGQDDGGYHRGQPQAAYAAFRSGSANDELEHQIRRAALDNLLAGGGESQAQHLSLSACLDSGARAHPSGLRNPPHQPRSIGRPLGQSQAHETQPASIPAWTTRARQIPESYAVVDLQELRCELPGVAAQRLRASILLMGMLPRGAAVYDLTVSEDHSFCIAGLFAHNTNCRCAWRIEDAYDTDGNFMGWNCTWVVDSGAESCQDCLDLGNTWNPLFIPAT